MLKEMADEITSLLQELPTEDEETACEIIHEIQEKLQEVKKIMQPEVDVIYDWDQYFMSIACLAALRSKDPRVPVS